MDKVAESLFEFGTMLAKEARRQQIECRDILKHLRGRDLLERCHCGNGDLQLARSRHLGGGRYQVTSQCDCCGEWTTREKEDPNI